MLRSFVTLLTFGLAVHAAHADSFMTETYTGSKTAQKIGSAPYTKSSDTSLAAAKSVSQRGIRLMKTSVGTAVVMDAIRIVNGATFGHPVQRADFARALATLAKAGTPEARFARGYNILLNNRTERGGTRGLALVRAAAKARPTDAAVQLGAFQAFAQYLTSTELAATTKQALTEEAAHYLGAAKATPKGALVKKGLALTTTYLGAYPELASAL